MERITKVLKTCSVVIVLLVGMVIGWLCRPINVKDTIVVQKDTIIVRDTLTIEKPIPVKVTQKETLLVAVTDTLRVKDTLYITLPKEVKVYANKDYYAEVCGYQPSLDYLEIYQKTTTISKTETVKEKKNYLSAGVEVGWCINPYTPIYLEYSRMLHKNVRMKAGVFRDLVKQENGVRFGIEAQIGW